MIEKLRNIKDKNFRKLNQIENFLNKFIDAKLAIGTFGDGLMRMKKFMELLGNPQESYRVIHLAGTSGKGSTAYYIAEVMKSVGLKCGLMVSPFVYDFRERIQINGEFAEIKILGESLEEMLWAIEEIEKLGLGKLSYFEIVTALGFLIFKKVGVKVAVIETGIGGRLDATNVVKNQSKICVLLKIGFDHMEILGEKIEMIAAEKAGIINEKSLVIALKQQKEVNAVFKKKCLEMGAKLVWVSKNVKSKGINFKKVWEMFEFRFKRKFGFENGWMAIVVAILVLKELKIFIDVDYDLIRKALDAIYDLKIPGRMEKKVWGGKEVWLDGGHNPQKIEFALKYLKENVSSGDFSVLIAFKKGKNLPECLKLITEFAKEIIVTEFKGKRNMVNCSVKGEEIVEVLKNLRFKNFKLIKNCEIAFQELLNSCCKNKLVIGSFYLLGELKGLKKKMEG